MVAQNKAKTHMNVPPGWAVLDCGATKSLAGPDPAALLTQACEKRGRKTVYHRKVHSMEEKSHYREIGEQVITSFIKWQVPGALEREDVHSAPGITDGSTPSLDGNDHLLP